MSHTCESCGDPASKRCSGCSKVWYCGTECQRSNWTVHLFDCDTTRRPITTADWLARAVRRDVLPEDAETCEDYGFTRAFDAKSRSMLLGLYIGLITYCDISPKTIHRWRTSGILIEQIKATFEGIPEHAMGSYYPWFLKNQWVLDRSLNLPNESPELGALVKVWLFIGSSRSDTPDQIKATISTWPEPKRECLSFYSMLLGQWHPAPFVAAWIHFGFCAGDEEHERRLAMAYNQLIRVCTFKEFCESYGSSSILALFQSKGLNKVILDIPYLGDEFIPYLEDVLVGSPKMFKSVWYLKQFVVSDNDVDLVPAVSIDYGFINCRDDADRTELKAAYKAYFDRSRANPLALHEAMIKGKLFEYMGELVKSKPKRFRRLMKNPYPLVDFGTSAVAKRAASS